MMDGHSAKANEEDHVGQLFMSWIKDTHETPSKENFIRLSELLAKESNDKQFVLRSFRLGINSVLTIVRLLDRSPVEKIDLYDNVIRDAGVQALAQLVRDSKTLTHLNLGANDIGPTGCMYIATLLPQTKKLRHLLLGSEDSTLHCNRIDTESAKALIDGISKNKNIKFLDLNRNPIGYGDQDAFLLIAKLLDKNKHLSALKLGVTNMQSPSAVALIKALHQNAALEFLDIHDNDLQPMVGEALGELFHSRNLNGDNTIQTLLLHNNPRMKAKGLIPFFKMLKEDAVLTTLNVANTGIANEGCIALADALTQNKSLTFVDLSNNEVEENGCIQLAQALHQNSVLKTLLLASNKLKDQGACALSNMLEVNHTLAQLDISSCWVSDAGMISLGVALAVNAGLQVLRLGNNHISDDAGRAFCELIQRNDVLLTIAIKGNQVSHSTLLQIKRIMKKNKAVRDNLRPNQMQQEVIRLHFQQYKLQEANQELKEHQKARMDLQDQAERNERDAQVDKENISKKSKEVIEKINMVDNFADELRTKRKQKEEESVKAAHQYDQDLKALQTKFKEDTKERETRQKECDDTEKLCAQMKKDRDDRLADLQARIIAARKDCAAWIEKHKVYRQQATDVQEEIQKIEAVLNENLAKLMAEKESKKAAAQEKKKGKKAKGDADALINSLLGGGA